jgi:hypothetical protein
MYKKAYKGWNAWWIERGPLTLILVPQVGGRIMGIRWHGRDLTFVNPTLEGEVEDIGAVTDVRSYKRKLGFLLWGGNKTWLAPQDRWTDKLPFLDLDAGAYDFTIEQNDENGVRVRMTSPICRETGIRIKRTISVNAGDAGWTVVHRLENHAGRTVQWAPWSVGMVLRPARVYLPTGEDSRYENGVKAFSSEGESESIRAAVVSYLAEFAVIQCTQPRKFKFGVDSGAGSMLAIFDVKDHGLVGLAKCVPTFHPQPYGHDCVAEVFNSSEYSYLEIELHGPVTTLEPSSHFELMERATLFDVATWPETASEIQQHFERLITAKAPVEDNIRM